MKTITLQKKNQLLVLSAIKKFMNNLEAKNAQKEGLSEPRKKWNMQEIELGGFKPIRGI